MGDKKLKLGQSVVIFLEHRSVRVYDTCYTSLQAEYALQRCWRQHGKHCRAKIVTAGQAQRLVSETTH